MARLTLRRCWLLAHRWLGLTLGMLLLVVAATGTVLVAAEPLDKVLHAHLFEAPGAGPAALDPVLQRLRTEFGAGVTVTLRPPREPDESLQAMVRGAWEGTVYFHPATAQELGRRAKDEGFFNLLFDLHSSLLAGDAGKPVLAAAALAYAVMLASGLVLWWPARWRHAWTVKTNAGLTRTLFDLHRVAGTLLGLLVLVAVVSGAYMAWRPLSAWVTGLSGEAPVRPPVVQPVAVTAPVPLDQAVAAARSQLPAGFVGYVQVPPPGKGPIRVRIRLADDPHPNGLSSVWLHPDSGDVLAVHRWTQLDPGARGYAYIYPLHIGELAGTATLLATVVAGLSLAGYGVSGLWMWWRRRLNVR